MVYSEFIVGDTVEAYKQFIGYVTYIDCENNTADVEWEEDKGWNSASVPLKDLKKVDA